MDTLIIQNFKGMQHTLQALTKSIKQMIREKKWAQKAHNRRERRRAARQKEVEDQPQIPVDSTPTPLAEGEDGIKAEAGIQPPTQDWAPPEIETEQPCETAVSIPEDVLENPATTQKKSEQSLTLQEAAIMRRDAKRMLRKTKGIAHTLLQATKEERELSKS
jgi:thiamine pyrophosphate-dependent acetolactate synthase large subunit-like protein